MKKYLLVALLCLGAVGASAYDYAHSVGGVIGSMYGVSYKGFIFGVPHLGLQTDLGVRLESTAAGYEGTSYSMDLYTFEVNPNVLYQAEIDDFNEGRVDWYAGGGTSLGLGHSLYTLPTSDGLLYGKFGLNALVGVEVVFDAPVTASLDFRPGYGLLFNEYHTISFFDWALAISIRYCF